MRRTLFVLLSLMSAALSADPVYWEKAAGLLADGRLDEAEALTKAALTDRPDDADALVIQGTLVLYRGLAPRYDDSIYRPNIDGSIPAEEQFTPEVVDAVAAYWKKVPALDPERTYLWGDLAQMTFRSGASGRAVDFALAALAAPGSTEDALRSAASVLALNLDWARAAQALQRIPGERRFLLYQGLEAWRTAKDGWRVPLKAFVDNPGTHKEGAALAAYLIGPAMRDTEAGFLEALKTDDGIASLAVRQKYVERYPNKFQPRLDFARSLSQFGSFTKALTHFAEIDRKAIASTPDERQSVLYQEAWAQQGGGNRAEAVRLWQMLADARDFYVRSSAAWFLGEEMLRQGKVAEAKAYWAAVANEPARSKYAYWANVELKKLK